MAKILLVDDSRLSRAMEGDVLRGAGHEVVEAVNGTQGLERLASESFDLVVSDLLMPGCDGIEMLRQIRASGNSVPVVIGSADIQESTRRICEELGIAGFLHKPVHGVDLLARIQTILASTLEPVQ
ncbi:MAG: response regulator [Planctomycetaceae bacterium]|nr:response regulator [Planctomycetaceae bacterium]